MSKQQYLKEYYEKHKDAILSSCKKYQKNNRDKINKRVRERNHKLGIHKKQKTYIVMNEKGDVLLVAGIRKVCQFTKHSNVTIHKYLENGELTKNGFMIDEVING